MSQGDLGFKVHITDTNGNRLKELSPVELNGLNALVTPAWVYSQKTGEVSWANSEAKSMYFHRSRKVDVDGKDPPVAIDPQCTMNIYAKVEEEQCTVHIVGPRWLLLSGMMDDLPNASNGNDEVVRLVVSPVSIQNANAMLFQQVSLNEINFGERIDVTPQDTPLDIVLRMLDMLISGVSVPTIHAKLIKDVLVDGSDINQPVLFSKSFQKAIPLTSKVSVVYEMLGMRPPTFATVKAAWPQNTSGNRVMYSSESPSASPRASIDTERPKVYEKYFPKKEMMCFDNVFDAQYFFDAEEVNRQCNGNVLSKLSFKIIEDTGLLSELKLNPDKLVAFLLKIESGYCIGRPYHNNLHAASVLHCMYMILYPFNLAAQLTATGHHRSKVILASFIAAIIHDYQHQGLSNSCLIDMVSPLAIIYNDISPQEQHHSASAFHLLTKTEFNFIELFDKESNKAFRTFVISMVLHTDMQKHFALMTKIKTASPCTDSILFEFVLKAADMCHIAYKFPLHRKWVKLLEDEMFEQGDVEKKLAMPVSPMCDRDLPGITCTQVEFFDFVALNIFKVLVEKCPGTLPMYNNVMRNYKLWSDRHAKDQGL